MKLEDPKYWKLLINQSLLRYYLLKTLSEKEIHGYGLVFSLSSISKGLCKPSQGTLYPALKELEKNGYVTGEWKRVKNRKRKVYKLTSKGKIAYGVATKVFQDYLPSILPFEKKKEKGAPLLPLEIK